MTTPRNAPDNSPPTWAEFAIAPKPTASTRPVIHTKSQPNMNHINTGGRRKEDSGFILDSSQQKPNRPYTTPDIPPNRLGPVHKYCAKFEIAAMKKKVPKELRIQKIFQFFHPTPTTIDS